MRGANDVQYEPRFDVTLVAVKQLQDNQHDLRFDVWMMDDVRFAKRLNPVVIVLGRMTS
jgi:hypothetical protein